MKNMKMFHIYSDVLLAMKKIKMFYVYSGILLAMSISYIIFFLLSLHINAMYENGVPSAGLASGFILVLMFALFLAFAIPLTILAKFNGAEPPVADGELRTLIIIGVVLMGIPCFWTYPKLNQELTADGYKNVLKMTSASKATHDHYRRLEKDGTLTLHDLAALLDTFEVFKDETKSQRKIEIEKKLASEKEAAKQELLHSNYNKPASAVGSNK